MYIGKFTYIFVPYSIPEVGITGQANFFIKIRKSQVRKFLGPFRFHKSFLGVPVLKSQIHKFLWLNRKTQIRNFLQNTAQLCLKKLLKVVNWTMTIKYKF